MTQPEPPPSRLLGAYAQSHPAEFALAVERAGGAAQSALLASLPESVLPAVVVNLPQDSVKALLDRASESELVRWLSEADLESAVRLARRLNQPRRTGLADRLPARRRKDLERYCAFPESTIGAWADPNFPSVNHAQSISEAVQALGSMAKAQGTPWLVVDGEGRLVGSLDSRLALLRGPDGLVRECLRPVRPLKANADLQSAAVEFAVRDEVCLPVIDGQSRLIGLLHRTRLPDGSPEPAAGTQSVLTALAGTMLEMLAELPTLAAAES